MEVFESMKEFMEAAALKKATLLYLASKLPEKYFDELRKVSNNNKIEYRRSL